MFSSVYAATEALIGVGVASGPAPYAVVPSSAYFEFIPAGEVDSPSPSTVTLEEVAEGESYEIAVTNQQGTVIALFRGRSHQLKGQVVPDV